MYPNVVFLVSKINLTPGQGDSWGVPHQPLISEPLYVIRLWTVYFYRTGFNIWHSAMHLLFLQNCCLLLVIKYPKQNIVIGSLSTLQTGFHLCIPKKDLAKPQHLMSRKYFQNRIIQICLELWNHVQCNSTRSSHSVVSIGNNMLVFPNGIMKFHQTGDSYLQIITTKIVP
jgi:hypothetical protein